MVLWNSNSQPRESLAGIQLAKGFVEMDFDTTLIPNSFLPDEKRHVGRVIDIGDKRLVIREISYLRDKNGSIEKATLRIEIVKNLIPFLAVMAALAVVGFVAVLFLREVRIIAEKSPILAGGAALALGFIAFKMFKRRSPAP